MINIGDKASYFRNPEDIMSLVIMEVVDVYEVSLQETFAKIEEKELAFNIGFGVRLDGKYGEERSSFRLT
jgi:hypothetical protein